MELDDSWITEYEVQEKDFQKFYKEPVESVEFIFLYVNKQNELEKIKKKQIALETENKIEREKLIKIIKENIIDNKIKYSLLSILQHNIDLEPTDLGKYISLTETEVENLKDTENPTDSFRENSNEYLNIISDICDLHFNDSINFFRSLDSVFVIFYETTRKLKKSSTKKIYLSSSDNRKTKRKPLKHRG